MITFWDMVSATWPPLDLIRFCISCFFLNENALSNANSWPENIFRHQMSGCRRSVAGGTQSTICDRTRSVAGLLRLVWRINQESLSRFLLSQPAPRNVCVCCLTKEVAAPLWNLHTTAWRLLILAPFVSPSIKQLFLAERVTMRPSVIVASILFLFAVLCTVDSAASRPPQRPNKSIHAPKAAHCNCTLDNCNCCRALDIHDVIDKPICLNVTTNPDKVIFLSSFLFLVLAVSSSEEKNNFSLLLLRNIQTVTVVVIIGQTDIVTLTFSGEFFLLYSSYTAKRTTNSASTMTSSNCALCWTITQPTRMELVAALALKQSPLMSPLVTLRSTCWMLTVHRTVWFWLLSHGTQLHNSL